MWLLCIVIALCSACCVEEPYEPYDDECEDSDPDPKEPPFKGPVTFTAVLSTSSLPGITVFDDVRTNNGELYDQSTGKFIANQNGVYAFYWTGVSKSRLIKTELLVNGESVSSATSDPLPEEGFPEDEAANTATLSLIKDDEVFVSSNGTLERNSVFTGFLVRDVQNPSEFFATSVEKTVATFSPISYENTILNTNNDFDGEKFTVSSNGTYVVSASASTFDASVAAIITQNGTPLRLSAVGSTSSTRFLLSTSSTFILKLNENVDEINVLAVGAEIPQLTIGIERQTIFTGFKLFSEDELPTSAVTIMSPSSSLTCSSCVAFAGTPVVLLDVNDDFNVTNGEFTAPEPGFYVIAVSIASSEVTTYDIVIANQTKYSGSNSGTGEAWVNESKRVVVENLTAGNTVKISLTGTLSAASLLSIWRL